MLIFRIWVPEQHALLVRIPGSKLDVPHPPTFPALLLLESSAGFITLNRSAGWRKCSRQGLAPLCGAGRTGQSAAAMLPVPSGGGLLLCTGCPCWNCPSVPLLPLAATQPPPLRCSAMARQLARRPTLSIASSSGDPTPAERAAANPRRFRRVKSDNPRCAPCRMQSGGARSGRTRRAEESPPVMESGLGSHTAGPVPHRCPCIDPIALDPNRCGR